MNTIYKKHYGDGAAKIVMLLITMLFSLTLSAASPKASAKFTTKSWDFETIDSSKPVSHEFLFVNNGDANLVIMEAKAECGCTKPEFPKSPIPPGKEARIKVTFNPAGFRGAFTKHVTVKTNGQPRSIRLTIKGVVK